MARFRFKIVDSSGRRRSGVLRADSLEVAESVLRSKLCQIQELIPLADDGQAVDVGKLEGSFTQIDRIRRGLAVLLGCVCAIALYSWATGQSKTLVLPAESKEIVKFKAKGELLLSAGAGDIGEWSVYVVFPDLPFEVGTRLRDDSNAFVLPVEYQGKGRPGQVAVDVERNGERWRLPDKVVMPVTGDLDLGALVVSPSPLYDTQTDLSGARAATEEATRKSTGTNKQRGQRITKANIKKALEVTQSGRRQR